MVDFLTSKEIIRGLDEDLVGLDEQKRQITAVYLKHYSEKRDFKSGDRRVIPLLIGTSGSGKTALAQSLAKITGRPFCYIDASNTAAHGYKGNDLSEKIGAFFNSLDRDKEKFKNSIIFIDEIDKWPSNTYKHQGGGITDQQQYLSFFDSDTFVASCDKTAVTLDTSNVLIILAGAFIELFNEQKKEANSFGFIKKDDENVDQFSRVEDMVKRLEKFGIIPEIIGRLGMVITMPEPDEELILKILSSKKSVLKKWNKYFKDIYSVKLSFNDEAKSYIAKSAIKMSLGVRAINHLINPLMNEALMDLEDDLTIHKVKVKYEVTTGLYKEYERGEERRIAIKKTEHTKIKRSKEVTGLEKIWYMYEDSKEQIEFLVETYTDMFSKENKNVSFKFLKKVEGLYRSTLMFLSSQVNYSEITEESLFKLLDTALKIHRETQTTFSFMIDKYCKDGCEFKEEIRSNYDNYLTIPHYLCTDKINDSILLCMMEAQMEGER